jgi:hypothetical protein
MQKVFTTIMANSDEYSQFVKSSCAHRCILHRLSYGSSAQLSNLTYVTTLINTFCKVSDSHVDVHPTATRLSAHPSVHLLFHSAIHPFIYSSIKPSIYISTPAHHSPLPVYIIPKYYPLLICRCCSFPVAAFVSRRYLQLKLVSQVK